MLKPFVCIVASMLAATVALAADTAIVQPARKKVPLTGYTRSRTKQTLAAEVSGKVLRVNYDVGQVIGKEPFLEVDPVFIEFQIEQTQWALQKLQVARTRNASQVAYLEKEYPRIDRRHADNVATEANWEAAAEELAQARMGLQATDLELKALAVQLQELKERRRRHRLTAPRGWIVIHKQVEAGEIIATGTPLAQVADFTQLVVPLFVSGPELEALRQPKQLDVSVAGRSAKARINWVNPDFDERTRKWAVELALVGYRGEPRGGLMTELIVDVAAEGLMVPRAAVIQRYDNPFVVLNADGRKIPVVILGETADQVLIADRPGLEPGVVLQQHNAVPGK
jgi:multidrug resistance efflux pump